jgi:hypothetical protein
VVGRPDKSAVGLMAHGQICTRHPAAAADGILGTSLLSFVAQSGAWADMCVVCGVLCVCVYAD